jgi:hypothetical protein
MLVSKCEKPRRSLLLAVALTAIFLGCGTADHVWRSQKIPGVWINGQLDVTATAYRSSDATRILVWTAKHGIYVIDASRLWVGIPNQPVKRLVGMAFIRRTPLLCVRVGGPKTELPEPTFTSDGEHASVEFFGTSVSIASSVSLRRVAARFWTKETFGQHVQQETPDELFGGKCHLPLLAVVRVAKNFQRIQGDRAG